MSQQPLLPQLARRIATVVQSGRGQLASRFAVVSALLSAVLVSVISSSFYLVTRSQLLEQYERTVRTDAALLAEHTAGLLAAIVMTLTSLSRNSVLATALVDSAGKETYLIPFLQGFQHISGVPVIIIFTDFEGKVIATNGFGRPTAQDTAWLIEMIETGSPSATIVSENGQEFLLVAAMLVYARTATPEGALLYKVPLDRMMPYSEGRLIYGTGGQAVVRHEDELTVTVPITAADILAPLHMAVQLSAPGTPKAGLFRWMLPIFTATAVLALAIIVLGSRLAGSYLTRSLRQLEQLASTIVRDGLVGQRAIVTGNDEVARLATAFNAMLDQLSAVYRDRERRAQEEIAIQRVLTEKATLACTEAECAKEEAERARREAIKANEAKSRFLAAASHDLRQPMQSLVLLSSLLAGKLVGHPAKPLIDHLDGSLDALRLLLDGLLDISKLDAGVVVPEFTVVKLDEILSRLEEDYHLRCTDKGIGFRLVRTGVWVRTDPALLERILRNLVENALRYTETGRILVGCRRQGRSVRIEVLDTGIGIAADHLKDIFQEYYQVKNSARDRSKGLGLGLAIVQRLSELLGHRVAVRSEPGKGSCFAITVPKVTAPRLMATAPGRPCTRLDCGFVLVVDDEEMIRDSLRLLLETWGWRVITASSGAEAVERLTGEWEVPLLVIADYMLEHGHTGLDAIGQIGAFCGRPVNSIILTGDTTPKRIAETQRSGHRILHKPVSPSELLALLTEMSQAEAGFDRSNGRARRLGG